MSNLKFHIVHYTKIFSDVGVTPDTNQLNLYLSQGREDVLDNFDIFKENVRSKGRKDTLFHEFKEVSENEAEVIVLGLYMELLEYWNKRQEIYNIIKFYCEKHLYKKVVVAWNHDVDSAVVFDFMHEFHNLYVLNFNTSIRHKRFIVLPFWTIDEELITEDKELFSNLICSFNHPTRRALAESFINNPRVYIATKLPFGEYKKSLSQSKFTFCPRGVGLSSYRFFECFHLNTIPVLMADDVIMPYEDKLSYDDFIIRIQESKANDPEFILNTLRKVDYDKMLKNLNSVRHHFTLGGVQQEIKNKLS